MFYRSQVYRLSPSLDLRSVRPLLNTSIANPHPMQFHHIVFNGTFPVATPPWKLLQQYHQAACNQDTRVRTFCLISTVC